jgi:serine/threonine protein kinase
MAAPATTVELLDQVRHLGLCDPTRLTGTFPADRPLPDSPTDVVKQLVREGVCTRFQGRMILAGKGRRLVLGKYRLLRPLGKGGGGSVFLGEHTDLRRRVAVKVQRNPGDDPLVAERFRREARSAAALDHTNIVKLFDFGVSHGVHYLVMEFVPGVTVQRLMDGGGPLSVPAAVHIVTQAALGLAHAHARGIVHRDVKPLNVMVMPDGGVKVLDMGLARAFDRSEDQLTEQAGDGTICGTIDYLSPEQCVGVAVDGRSDIYNLGVMLFALLAGRLPFLGTPAEKVAQHQAASPLPLESLVPAVPAALARVVDQMMAKRPGERHQTCHAVVEALAPWCPAAPPDLGMVDPQRTVNLRSGRKTSVDWSADESRRNAIRRWKRVAWAVGILAAVALVGGLVFAFLPPPATAVQPETEVELLLVGHQWNVNELVFTPDGTRLIGVDWSGGVCVWDTATGSLISRQAAAKAGATGNHLALTPSGQVLLCGARMPTTLWDVETGEAVLTYEERTTETWAVVASPDGKRVLIAGEKDVALRDARTGEVIRVFDAQLEFVWSTAFSSDGKLVAAGGRMPGEKETGTVAIWETETGRVIQRLTGLSGDVRWVAFSPDGGKVASCGFDQHIQVWNLATGGCENTFTDTNHFVERVQFLPDGRILSSSACDYTLPEPHTSAVCVWDPTRPEATPVWTRHFPGRATTVAYSPTAGLYAVANKSNQVWLLKAPAAMTGR